MDGRYCERGEECGRTVSVGVTDGKTITTDVGESYTATNATSDSRTYTTTLGISFDMPPGMGGIKIPLPEGSDLTGLGVPKVGVTYSKAYAKALSWTQTVARGHTFSISNSTSYSLNIGESDSLSRPSWSQGYCGSWFAVPVIGLTCGRGARGDLVPSDRRGGSQCLLNPEDSAFSHCFNYTFTDNRLPGQTKHKTVFVLRDCDQGFILPGEWQHPVFAYSFLPQTLVTDHILRYGWKEFPDTRNKPQDDEWVHQKHLMSFTKTLGPVDHTVELCGRGKYCSRHKLTPGNCYNIPRGYAGTRSSYIVSAKTTPGNCCVLFSRQECHGVAQVVKGDIPDFFAVGYEGQAHSVVCNVEEYCNPNIIDSLTLS
ncbi:hypothetical protein B0T24DRAFT_652551 [Lasiosphaeria ovina]|uniref:Uncharacterized protein n=1 Tax=Lasiosphaeria ovina TaxID=92902 RepID=A0AAE0MZD4_9PEZI|nr:hypothetical protein B0T24DRAFT_652551 [Lasiosphaeria ovina]